MVVETLAEKHFDLAFRMLHEFDLPGINIGLLDSVCAHSVHLILRIDVFLTCSEVYASLLQLTYCLLWFSC
jgi:hypothetical protein